MKKIFTFVLLLMLVLSLAACGGNGSSGNSNTNAPASQGNTETSTAPSSAPDDTPSSEDTQAEPAFAEGVWPDVEHTQQVPKPSFTVGSIEDEYYASMKWLRINFVDVTYDEAIAYVDELKAAGYTAEENIVLDSPGSSYVWNAENSAGTWYVSFSVNDSGEASLEIRKI